MAKKKVVLYQHLQRLAGIITNKFVAQESGKGLSTNDYTTAEKNKLANIAADAEANVIESVKVNGTALTPDATKAVNVDLSDYALKSDVSSVYKYKGSVNNYSSLPTSGQSVGDVYNVETADASHGIKAGDNVAWTGSAWDVLAGTVDLSAYATTDAMNTALAGKVDKVAGKGLSTNDYTTAEKNKLAGLVNYTHPTGDGNLHVPANGTTNAGKVLTAGATAGVYTWEDIEIDLDDYVDEITNAEIDALFE